MWTRRRRRTGLLAAARREYLTPRRDFGPSVPVGDCVARTADGAYLLLAPHLGEGEPVHSVGWAPNDYWAVRLWGKAGHAFRNDHDPAVPATAAPSLAGLGWPDPLGYAETLAAAKERARDRVMVTAEYRLTDGSFTAHTIRAAPRVRFCFEQANPAPDDLAVGVELGLSGRRWTAHLAEVKAINEENRRRGIV